MKESKANHSSRFYLLLAAITGLIICLDQWTKALVTEKVALHEELPSIFGIFHITHTENDGAIWGILSGQTWLFILIMIIFLAALLLMIWRRWVTKKFELICLSLIAGGGIGNMIDRVAYGKVTDMIEFDFVSFPVFNVADCFITIGCAALMIYLLFFDHSIRKASEKKNDTMKQ